MSVFVYFKTDNYNDSYQFSNLIFAGILGFAEESGVSPKLLRMLNQGFLMHGVCIEDYSIDTQIELVDFIGRFLKYVSGRISSVVYLEHIEGFASILTARKGSL